MKKRILALAFVMLMFPVALLLTACGGGELQVGKTYVFDKIEVAWDAAEKELFLGTTGMTEEQMLAGSKAMFESQTLVFNEDGTATSTMNMEGEEFSQTMYYVVDGDTVTIYQDAEHTESSGSVKVVGSTIVMEEGLEEGMKSKIKVVYKVA